MFNLNRLKIRARLLNDPYYRMRSLPEILVAAELGIQIDVNQASVDDWLRLPGISIHQARSLVDLVGMGVQLLCLEDVAAAIGVPVHRLKPLEPVLAFIYYDPQSLIAPQRLNPNLASQKELSSIPVVENSLAKKIVSNRKKNGNYRDLADLQRRLKLNGEAISQLIYYLQF
ncbi:MAG: helix-hairpin-helix domain-containing protein [Xenococcaceae cyanobacterium]